MVQGSRFCQCWRFFLSLTNYFRSSVLKCGTWRPIVQSPSNHDMYIVFWHPRNVVSPRGMILRPFFFTIMQLGLTIKKFWNLLKWNRSPCVLWIFATWTNKEGRVAWIGPKDYSRASPLLPCPSDPSPRLPAAAADILGRSPVLKPTIAVIYESWRLFTAIACMRPGSGEGFTERRRDGRLALCLNLCRVSLCSLHLDADPWRSSVVHLLKSSAYHRELGNKVEGLAMHM